MSKEKLSPDTHTTMTIGFDGVMHRKTSHDSKDAGGEPFVEETTIERPLRRMQSSNISAEAAGVRQRRSRISNIFRHPEQDLTQQQQQQIVQQVSLNYKPTKSGKDTLEAVYKTGEYKAALPMNILMVQSFMAGIYIAMAGHLFLAVGGGVLGAALFPTGLIAVILTSAELFTGDSLVFVASVLGRRVAFSKLIRNWTVSWIMNFAGCLFWAYVLAYASDSLESLDKIEFAVAVALKKTKPSWLAIFLKGVAANFLVCVGVWQAACAEEVAGKILSLWFPINAFVLMGFDHCVANQFLIPLGMMLGADISINKLLFEALLPATLGNIVGGGLLVGAIYWYVFDSKMRITIKLRLPVVVESRVRKDPEQPEHSEYSNNGEIDEEMAVVPATPNKKRSARKVVAPEEEEDI